MAKVVAICGMPGSGKGIFSETAKKLGIPVRSMGDMIRSEVISRGLPEDPHIFGKIAQELRNELGDGFLAARLAPVINSELGESELVVIEGMRGVAERDIFVDYWGNNFSILAIISEIETRFQRIISRGRSEDGDRESFDIRDEREIGWGLDELINGADEFIENNGTMDEFIESCNKLLKELSA